MIQDTNKVTDMVAVPAKYSNNHSPFEEVQSSIEYISVEEIDWENLQVVY